MLLLLLLLLLLLSLPLLHFLEMEKKGKWKALCILPLDLASNLGIHTEFSTPRCHEASFICTPIHKNKGIGASGPTGLEPTP
jgi:hypothetical protein